MFHDAPELIPPARQDCKVVQVPRSVIPTLSSPRPGQCSVHSCYKLPRSPQNSWIAQ